MALVRATQGWGLDRRAARKDEKAERKQRPVETAQRTAPVPDADKQVRHRAGADDHLELGIVVRRKRKRRAP